MAWATTLLAHNDVLQAYQKVLKESEPELLPTQGEKHKHADTTIPPNIPKGKADKMPPMERQIPDPLKQLRQQQATTAKL